MNLYLVTRTDEAGYDEFCGFVVAAESDDVARNTNPGAPSNLNCWVTPDKVQVKLIGIAVVGIEAGVIISDFMAG